MFMLLTIGWFWKAARALQFPVPHLYRLVLGDSVCTAVSRYSSGPVDQKELFLQAVVESGNAQR